MNSLQQQSYQETSHNRVNIKELFPALPIIDKPIKQLPKPTLKVQIIKNESPSKDILRPIFKKLSEQQNQQQETEPNKMVAPFDRYCGGMKCMYKKYNNNKYNKIHGLDYYASIFLDKNMIKNNKQQLKNVNQLLNNQQTDKPINNNQVKSHQYQVIFDSNFQSGNLFAAFRKSICQYDLILQNDINSKGNTQWFYFSVTNLPKDLEITFNIVNLLKTDSLFNYGMQPVVFSQSRYQNQNEGWMRSGKSISYTKNSIRQEQSKRFYHTLSFKITSKISGDTLYIAHCFPYTYTKLNQYILQITSNQKKPIISRSTIGKSVGNNNIQVLSITQPNFKKKDNDTRKIILILARQHPGESQGSYVCQGIISYLIGKTKQAEFIRKYYIIKVIPMVNPDGVIVGNYRSNLMGNDLNRKWDAHDKEGTFPEINCIKKFITQFNKEKKLKFILDLHGHSKKLNSFFYGNPYPQHPEVVRAFPYFCSKMSNQVSFEDCTFTIEEQKKRAARVYLSLAHQLINVYTFESSFYGYVKENKKIAFGIQQYKNLGTILCQSLYAFLQFEYFSDTKSPEKSNSNYQKCLNELRDNPNLIMMGNKIQSGSESDPEEFQLVPKQKDFINHITDATLTIPEQIKPSEQLEVSLQQRSSSKNKRDIRQFKISNQMKSEIKRANSIPKKYQQYNAVQSLQQPLSNIQKVSTHQIYKQRNSQKYDQCLLNRKQNKINIQTQTLSLDEQMWEEIKPISTVFFKTQNFEEEYRPSVSYKDNINLKYISLKAEKKDNRHILKLDLVTRPRLITNRNIILRNTYSQTFLSFTYKYELKNYFPTVKLQKKQTHRMNMIKSTRLVHKKQNQDALTEMVRKYLTDMKQKQKQIKPIMLPNQQNNHFTEKSLPKNIQQTNDRPLNIKKKEISLIGKRGHSPKKF